MLANNNKAMLKRLARNTVKTNRRQFAILFFTVALAACMLFCVFTIGITYLHLSRLQDTRLFGAEYDAVVANGFTEEQKAILIGPIGCPVGGGSFLCRVREEHRCRRYDRCGTALV